MPKQFISIQEADEIENSHLIVLCFLFILLHLLPKILRLTLWQSIQAKQSSVGEEKSSQSKNVFCVLINVKLIGEKNVSWD